MKQATILVEFAFSDRIVRCTTDGNGSLARSCRYVLEQRSTDAMGIEAWTQVRDFVLEKGGYEYRLCERIHGLHKQIESLQHEIELLTNKQDGTKVP